MEIFFNEGNQIHNVISNSGSGTVINYGSGSGSNFLTSYGSDSGSGSTSQKVTVPTVRFRFQFRFHNTVSNHSHAFKNTDKLQN
jgi:hypothetical protein